MIRYIWLHLITFRHITNCYFSLQFVTIRDVFVTFRYNSWRFCYISLQFVMLCYISLQFVTFCYILLHYDSLLFVTIYDILLHFVTLCYISLHFVTTRQKPLQNQLKKNLQWKFSWYKKMTRTIHYCNFCDYKSDRRYDRDKHVSRKHGNDHSTPYQGGSGAVHLIQRMRSIQTYRRKA